MSSRCRKHRHRLSSGAVPFVSLLDVASVFFLSVYVDTSASRFDIQAFPSRVLDIYLDTFYYCIDILYSQFSSNNFITFIIRYSVSRDLSEETHFCCLSSWNFFRLLTFNCWIHIKLKLQLLLSIILVKFSSQNRNATSNKKVKLSL
jgi:hypothetical protein